MNSINDDGLRECPFCGKEAKIAYGASSGPCIYHEGGNYCPLPSQINTSWGDEKSIIKVWNTRHQPANQEDCRTSFEKWYADNHSGCEPIKVMPKLGSTEVEYLNGVIASMWTGWRAAYNYRPAAEPNGDLVEAENTELRKWLDYADKRLIEGLTVFEEYRNFPLNPAGRGRYERRN